MNIWRLVSLYLVSMIKTNVDRVLLVLRKTKKFPIYFAKIELSFYFETRDSGKRKAENGQPITEDLKIFFLLKEELHLCMQALCMQVTMVTY